MASQEQINFKVSAPGKVVLFGDHSVVYGKTAVAASLSFRTMLHLSEIFDAKNRINMILPLININHAYSVSEINKLLKDSPPPLLKGNYSNFNLAKPDLIDIDQMIVKLRGYIQNLIGRNMPLNQGQESALVAFFLLLNGMFSCVNIAVTSFTLNVTSDLSIGAGTGSSASYGVCLAAAFYQYLRKRVANDGNLGKDIARSGFKTTKITSTDLSVFDEQELNIILGWGMLSDKVMHGNPSGIDATVITFGKVIKFRRDEPGKLPTINQIPLAESLKILLVNSGVSRNTKGMIAGVAALRDRYPKIVNSVLIGMDEVSLAALGIFNELEDMKDSSYKEVPIVGEKVDYSIGKLGELIDINQSLLCSLGVSHPTLNEICSIARDNGFSGKLTGAGGGGYAYVLIPPSTSMANVNEFKQKLQARGYSAWLAEMGGTGLILEDNVALIANTEPTKAALASETNISPQTCFATEPSQVHK